MSKSKKPTVSDWEPPIDASYTAHVNGLSRVDGRLSDDPQTYAIERAQRPPQNYVPAHTGRTTAHPMSASELTALNNAQHVIDVPLSATQHIEMKTSAVDRALGFLIANVPLFAAFAVGVVLVSYVGFNVPFLSIPALVIFWLSFVAAWLISYGYTLSLSAEGVAHYEARQKWQVIKREQKERWNHYNKRLTDEN